MDLVPSFSLRSTPQLLSWKLNAVETWGLDSPGLSLDLMLAVNLGSKLTSDGILIKIRQ